MIDLSAKITIPKNLQADLKRLATLQRPITQAAAQGIEEALHDHFRMLQTRPRRDGLAHVGFWSSADGHSVREQIGAHRLHSDGRASVTIDDPRLAHKLTGGTIKASDYQKTYLTIPATDAAAKAIQGARQFESHLAWVPHPDGGLRPALVQGPRPPRRQPGQPRTPRTPPTASQVLYWLVRQVTHKPQDDALPTQSALESAAHTAALDALDTLLGGAA